MILKKHTITRQFSNFILCFCANLSLFQVQAQQTAQDRPNVLIIHTDEHNLRTLGCYRDTMTDDQAFMWGRNTVVTTPHIDRLATEGVLCTNFYAASPVCTPSRASFISGLYPVATGSPKNDLPLNDGLATFASILGQNGYATSYVGKWHLDGKAKPGFEPARKFGFEDNRYMFNRGHWKGFKETEQGVEILGQYNPVKGNYKFDTSTATEETFATDFLFSKAISIIDRDKNSPFCLMLSIPDPHGGNTVRPPYDTMFESMYFENPVTMDKDPGKSPKWNKLGGKNQALKKLNQASMQKYYGMVKCIDDNMGRLFRYLEAQGLMDNTLIVFTSDHGDLMGEHGKHNKGLPYTSSAKIPFLMRYPTQIGAGKQIHTPLSTIDFTPTLLGMLDIETSEKFHGADFSSDITEGPAQIEKDRYVYITHAASRWAALVSKNHKLVLSPSDKPMLFDLKKDPNEIDNFYTDPAYKTIAAEMQKELLRQLKHYKDPILTETKLILN